MVDSKKKWSVAEQLLLEFESATDSAYRSFLIDKIKVTTNPSTVLGIRMTVIRKYAGKLGSVIDIDQALELLHPKAGQWYEYKLLFGLVLQKVTPLERVQEVLPLMYDLCDGWAVPDLYMTIFSHFANNGSHTEVLRSISRYSGSVNPFARRLTIVVQMPLFKSRVVSLHQALVQCSMLQWDDEYLVQMGIAWTLAELYVSNPKEVDQFILGGGIESGEVLKKYHQKLRDSLRVKK